jgi:hypothetical protein
VVSEAGGSEGSPPLPVQLKSRFELQKRAGHSVSLRRNTWYPLPGTTGWCPLLPWEPGRWKGKGVLGVKAGFDNYSGKGKYGVNGNYSLMAPRHISMKNFRPIWVAPWVAPNDLVCACLCLFVLVSKALYTPRKRMLSACFHCVLPNTPGQLPKLNVAGSTPVSRSAQRVGIYSGPFFVLCGSRGFPRWRVNVVGSIVANHSGPCDDVDSAPLAAA